MVDSDIKNFILIGTAIFLIAPTFIVVYIFIYNQRKKRHIEEKKQMKLNFEAEIAKTQLEIQEQTMQTIGADLHDNIGQLLSLTSLTLNSVELEGAHKAQPKIDAAIDLTAKSIQEMRLLGKLLQGDQLVGLGLHEAIRYQINWLERSGQYEISYNQESEMPAENNPNTDLILFRILQEILNNIIKHARATHIEIRLEYSGRELTLQIDDNGIGFDLDNLHTGSAGMGLHNIQKRAEIVGGRVNIESKAGRGTSIALIIPYP
jgi:two-component system NarL family sensor kinase